MSSGTSNKMKALVKAKPEPGLWMEYVDVPEPEADEVLIRVKKSAICGTDVHIWNWDEWSAKTVPVPMVVGHEFCGEIVDKGSAARKFQIGQRVSGEGHIVCGICRNCRAGRGHLCRNTKGVGVNRPGSFAEYLCIPEDNVVIFARAGHPYLHFTGSCGEGILDQVAGYDSKILSGKPCLNRLLVQQRDRCLLILAGNVFQR